MQALADLRRGMGLDPSARQLIEPIADHLAKSNEWAGALAAWEELLKTGPFSVGLMHKAGRARARLGHIEEALRHASSIQRLAPASTYPQRINFEIALQRDGIDQALLAGKACVERHAFDLQLLDDLFAIARRKNDLDTAEQAMLLRMEAYPQTRVEAALDLARMFQSSSDDKSIAYFRKALVEATPTDRNAVMSYVPLAYRRAVRLAGTGQWPAGRRPAGDASSVRP